VNKTYLVFGHFFIVVYCCLLLFIVVYCLLLWFIGKLNGNVSFLFFQGGIPRCDACVAALQEPPSASRARPERT
jgi:hypothetical protein